MGQEAKNRQTHKEFDTGVFYVILAAGRDKALNVAADIGAIARAFVDARRNSYVVPRYPGLMPATLGQAYAIQDNAMRLLGEPVGGWKVGRIPDHLTDQYGAYRIAGPIFAPMVMEATTASVPEVPVLAGFAAVEAELLLRIGGVIAPDAGISAVAGQIDEVRFGLEIASSPFPAINEHGPAVTASDFGNNFGLVLGPRIADWRTRDLMNAPVQLTIDGQTVGNGTAASMLDGPFGAVAFLAALLAERGIDLPVGSWVSTGAITGVHQVKAGQIVAAVFDNRFSVSCRTCAFAPGRRNGLGA